MNITLPVTKHTEKRLYMNEVIAEGTAQGSIPYTLRTPIPASKLILSIEGVDYDIHLDDVAREILNQHFEVKND